jgi:glycosyltransferase involved in cell wall biosynthesis
MKISLFSAFYPFRGGIAQFNERLVEELDKAHEVDVFTFRKQYPDWLFPGSTQYVETENKKWVKRAQRIVSTFNPITYFSGARKIKSSGASLFIANYWMTIFAPFLSVFSSRLKGNSKRLLLVHNLQPHEPRFFDAWLNHLVLKRFDGVVVLSQEVKEQVLASKKDAKVKVLYHPWYNHFQPKTAQDEARNKLGIQMDAKVLLFFGLIRDYKGLDCLLEAFATLDPSYQLIISGEFYGKRESYDQWLNDSLLKERIHLADHFIPDDNVHTYFSAADLCVLPYRTATQSGVTATAFHFGVPALVTDVGGLKDAVGKKGVAIPKDDPTKMASTIDSMFRGDVLQLCKQEIEKEREQFSWDYFARELVQFADEI